MLLVTTVKQKEDSVNGEEEILEKRNSSEVTSTGAECDFIAGLAGREMRAPRCK